MQSGVLSLGDDFLIAGESTPHGVVPLPGAVRTADLLEFNPSDLMGSLDGEEQLVPRDTEGDPPPLGSIRILDGESLAKNCGRFHAPILTVRRAAPSMTGARRVVYREENLSAFLDAVPPRCPLDKDTFDV